VKKLVFTVLALALALSISACGGNPSGLETPGTPPIGSTSPGAPPPSGAEGVNLESLQGPTGEVLRYTTSGPNRAVKADPTTLYVGQTSVPIQSGNPGSGSDSCFYTCVFDRLIEFDYDTGHYVGHVIKDWKLADDGLSMEISMPDNIVFHNGTKATIDDVLYSLWRLSEVELSTQSDKTVFGNIDFDKCEVSGDYAAKLVFKKPSLGMVAGFTNAFLLSKEYIERVGEDNAWWNACIGTGPYKVESIIQGDRYNLVKSDSYWGSIKGSFDKIIIRFYAEASTLYMDYETGILDIIVNPLAVDVGRVINGDVNNTVCDIYPMLFLAYIGFNEEMNPVLKDMNVRKAIILSVDPAVITKMAVDFLGVPATSLMQTGLIGRYDKEIVRDIDGAKAALAEAGYGPGELKLSIGTSTNNVNLAVAEAVQAQLADAGIIVEMITADPAVNLNNLRNAGSDTYDIAQGFFQYITLDPNAILMAVSKSAGSTTFLAVTDDKAEELSMKAMSALSEDEKEAALIELQGHLYDNWWYLPLYEQKVAIIYKDYITGIRAIAPRMLNINAVTLVS
jgi:ABC-type transport system substrate-binding protein